MKANKSCTSRNQNTHCIRFQYKLICLKSEFIIIAYLDNDVLGPIKVFLSNNISNSRITKLGHNLYLPCETLPKIDLKLLYTNLFDVNEDVVL